MTEGQELGSEISPTPGGGGVISTPGCSWLLQTLLCSPCAAAGREGQKQTGTVREGQGQAGKGRTIRKEQELAGDPMVEEAVIRLCPSDSAKPQEMGHAEIKRHLH